MKVPPIDVFVAGLSLCETGHHSFVAEYKHVSLPTGDQRMKPVILQSEDALGLLLIREGAQWDRVKGCRRSDVDR